jgi:hypothetical protein
MSSSMGESDGDDWSAGLAALQRLHGRLSTTADALRGVLARPGASWDGEVTGLEWDTKALAEAERAALYESVGADLQRLEALAEQLAQVAALLEAHAPPGPHDKPLLPPTVPRS